VKKLWGKRKRKGSSCFAKEEGGGEAMLGVKGALMRNLVLKGKVGHGGDPSRVGQGN